MNITRDDIRQIVEQLVEQTLVKPTQSCGCQTRPAATKKVISEADVLAASGEIVVDAGAIITPLAKDTAKARGIRFVPTKAAATPQNQPADPKTGPKNGTIALGSDHGGFRLKEALKVYLKELGYEVRDVGCHDEQAVDYPDLARAVAQAVAGGECSLGIMIDGAGIGSCMAANKVAGIRAALCHDQYTAINSREHNNANVLTLGAQVTGEGVAKQIAKVWLETAFTGGRHARRVAKIDELDRSR